MIQTMLERSGRKIRFRSEPATKKNINGLFGSGCQMLHFSGHGDENCLEIESGRHCGMADYLEVPHVGCLFVVLENRILPLSREMARSHKRHLTADTLCRFPHFFPVDDEFVQSVGRSHVSCRFHL